jgi:low affinity Fe/Cu permease
MPDRKSSQSTRPTTASKQSARSKPSQSAPSRQAAPSKQTGGSKQSKPSMPGDVDSKVGWFDRFADVASKIVSRAWFFAFCLLLVIVWAPSIIVLHSVSIWQLIINTATTIITFLLVALLQNTQERSNNAIQAKLNAIADSMSDLMEAQGLAKDAKELRSAVGLEDRESSDGK